MSEYGWTPAPDQLLPCGLPQPRGPLSTWLLQHLSERAHPLDQAPEAEGDALHGEDAALALYVLYELHYRGFAGVDEAWEWHPGLLEVRARLEARFLEALRARVGELPTGGAPREALEQAMSIVSGPSLSEYVADRATLDQVRELAVQRSGYQLKEADPHSFALPRLSGRAKAAMVEIQADEYGEGKLRDAHSTLFGLTMTELGLDPSYGHYLDHLPGVTLATVNLVSLFGLHRRWRGALCGHLATFELTSVTPMGNYAAGLRRLGLSTAARHFYEVHVVADAHHGSVAADELVGGLLEQEPELFEQVMLGAAAVSVLERAFADHVLQAFQSGQSSLRLALRPPLYAVA